MFKQSPKKKILIGIILISIFMILIITKNTRKNFIEKESNPESLFAIYINDAKTTHFPSKEDEYSFDEEKSSCNNGVNINWSYLLWTANIDFTNYELQNNKERTYCNLYFKKEEYKFDYTGDYQEFVVPKDGYYQVELWGASAENASERNGAGAYTIGDIYLLKNESLFLYVGGMQAYNGGGTIQILGTNKGMRYGGGATDIRIKNGSWNEAKSLSSRIMVAGGGGSYSHGGNGGPGGNLKGRNGIPFTDIGNYSGENSCGYGGTQTSGGAAGYHNYSYSSVEPTAGSFGKGGNGEDNYGGCGGGGYYGGGGAGINPHGKAGGGGGSSYISGFPGCIAITSEINQTPKVQIYTKIEDSYHYSGKIFTNGTMIAGDEEMPAYNEEETMVGNRGNGYARITYLGK